MALTNRFLLVFLDSAICIAYPTILINLKLDFNNKHERTYEVQIPLYVQPKLPT
jgi:hypothetical protein